jgi:hypothetical protein
MEERARNMSMSEDIREDDDQEGNTSVVLDDDSDGDIEVVTSGKTRTKCS